MLEGDMNLQDDLIYPLNHFSQLLYIWNINSFKNECSAQDGTRTHFLNGLYDTWLINERRFI